MGSGYVNPHGQREDALSSHVCVGVVLKEGRSMLEAVVRVCPLHNNELKHCWSGLARREVVLGISAHRAIST